MVGHVWWRFMAKCIGNDVHESAFEKGGVNEDGREVIREVRGDSIGRRTDLGDRRGDDHRQVGRRKGHLQRPRLDAADVEQKLPTRLRSPAPVRPPRVRQGTRRDPWG